MSLPVIVGWDKTRLMSFEAKPPAHVSRWRLSGRLMVRLAALASVGISGPAFLARSAAAVSRRERRESREWVALYRDVMVNQQQQPWAPLRGEPSAALRSDDIWCAIRASDNTDRKLIDQFVG